MLGLVTERSTSILRLLSIFRQDNYALYPYAIAFCSSLFFLQSCLKSDNNLPANGV